MVCVANPQPKSDLHRICQSEGGCPHRQKLSGQIPSVVDASVHGDEALQRGLVLHAGVVEAGVEHDDGERQDVACVWCPRARCTRTEGQRRRARSREET